MNVFCGENDSNFHLGIFFNNLKNLDKCFLLRISCVKQTVKKMNDNSIQKTLKKIDIKYWCWQTQINGSAPGT